MNRPPFSAIYQKSVQNRQKRDPSFSASRNDIKLQRIGRTCHHLETSECGAKEN